MLGPKIETIASITAEKISNNWKFAENVSMKCAESNSVENFTNGAIWEGGTRFILSSHLKAINFIIRIL